MSNKYSRSWQPTAGLTRRNLLSRGAALAAAATVTPSLLTACGSSSPGTSAQSGPLTFWNFYGPNPGPLTALSKWFVDLVAAWNKENKTKINLQYVPQQNYIQKRDTAFQAGSGPDIFLSSPEDFLQYYNGGIFHELTPYMSKAEIADFYPNVMQTRMVNGKIYALPMEVGPMAFFYSQDAFEKAHLSEGDIPQTWDSLLNVAAKLTTKSQYGLAFETTPGEYQNFTWYPFMWEAGGDVKKFDQSGPIAALTFWQDAVKSGVAAKKLLGTGGNDVLSNLKAGYCAIQNCGSWGVSVLNANAKGYPYGVFKLPTPPGGTYTTVFGGWSFVVNTRGKDPETAAKFAVWALASAEGAKRMTDWCMVANSELAPRQAAQKLGQDQGFFDSGPMKVFKDEVFPGSRGEPRYPPQVGQAITQAITSTQLGGSNPGSAAASAAGQINSYLSTYKGAPLVA
jgi:multiple sugar transport system substrate-binding protein